MVENCSHVRNVSSHVSDGRNNFKKREAYMEKEDRNYECQLGYNIMTVRDLMIL